MNEIYKYFEMLDIEFLLEQHKNSIYEDEKLNVKTNDWKLNHFSITCCYSLNDNIYINIISNSNYKNYFNYIRQIDIKLNLDLFYTFICKTFDYNCLENKDEKYKLMLHFSEN